MTSEGFDDVGFMSPDLAHWTKKVREDHAQEFAVADDVNRVGMRLLFALPTEDATEAQLLAAASFGRAMQPYQVSLLLAERGALAEARAAARLCCEAVIAFGGLMRVPGTVELLRQDMHTHRIKLSTAMLDGVDGKKPDVESAGKFVKVIKASREALGEKKPHRIVWATLANQAGLKGLFALVYRIASGDAAHLTIGALQRHIISGDRNELMGFKFRPEEDDLAQTLFMSVSPLIYLFGMAVEWFDLAEFAADRDRCVLAWRGMR